MPDGRGPGGCDGNWMGLVATRISRVTVVRERAQVWSSVVARGLERIPSLARPRRKTFLVSFVVKGMVMVTYSGSAPFPPPSSLQHVRDLPEFASLMSLDRSNWPPLSSLAWLVAWS